MPGRTHGKHALPITYGYKVAVWINELTAAVDRMKEAEKRVFTVMMGGAVGAFHSSGELGRKVQDRVAEDLGMYSMPIPSATPVSSVPNTSPTWCCWQPPTTRLPKRFTRTSSEEFAEVSEAFAKGTVGSSTMPQKVNPKLAKGIIANSQKLYSVATASFYVTPRPFEADSSAYFIFDASLQEAIELMAEVVLRAEELTRTLVINPEMMYRNVMITKGLINSEKIMMSLVDRLGKDPAHELVYEMAMKSTHEGIDYSDVLKNEPMIVENFSEQEIQELVDPKAYVGLCSTIAEEFAQKALERNG